MLAVAILHARWFDADAAIRALHRLVLTGDGKSASRRLPSIQRQAKPVRWRRRISTFAARTGRSSASAATSLYALLDGNPAVRGNSRGNKRAYRLIWSLTRQREDADGFQILPRSRHGAGRHRGVRILCLARQCRMEAGGPNSRTSKTTAWQTKTFAPTPGRYQVARSGRNTDGNNDVGYAEVDVITN